MTTTLRRELPEPGAVIGGYRVERLLGLGGMGAVFLARQLNLDREVALKLMHPKVALEPGNADRFAREAKVTAALRHPNAIEIYDFGDADGYLYLAMEVLSGTTLRELVDEHLPLLPLPRVLEVIARIADVLAVAHAIGIVHRDLKPENVFLDRQSDGKERIVVVDFGLAFSTEREDLGRLTRDGMITGTPDYLSPEQAQGKRVGTATDIYALGCMLFEMLTGVVPFRGHPMQVMTKQMYAAPPRPSEVAPRERAIPRELEELCLQMLHKVPEVRPTAQVVAGVVETLAAGGTKHLRAREETGAQGRAARMISVAHTPTLTPTIPPGAAAPGAVALELAVLGVLDGDLALGLAANGIMPFIVSDEQPIGDADAVFAPGASLELLGDLRRRCAVPLLTDAAPHDGVRVPALLRVGVDEVVTTPVRSDQLAKRVWRAIRRARGKRAVADT